MNPKPGTTLKWLAICALLQTAQALATERQDLSGLPSVAENYLKTQTAGLPGKVTIAINQPDARLKLPACASLEAFMPPGSRSVGKTTVGLRCLSPSNWAIYLPAHIRHIGNYVSAAAGLGSGQPITADSLLLRSADLGNLPDDVVTDPAKAIGMSLTTNLTPGMPLRQGQLRAPMAVQQGQAAQLVVSGNGFIIHSAGRALANAKLGQTVRIRTESGQIISGTARAENVVAVSN
jgi:flagella basal body P-ring formation protein FlgA